MSITGIDTIKVHQTDNNEYDTQINSEHTRIPINNNLYYLVQNSVLHEQDGKSSHNLYLGPNEVFFSKSGSNLTLYESVPSSDIYNQNNKYKYIGNISQIGEVMYWGFYLPRYAERIQLYCEMTVDNRSNTTLRLSVDSKQSVTFNIVDNTEKYTFAYEIGKLSGGYHTIELEIINKAPKIKTGNLYFVKLCSDSELYVVRERWRPVAAYGKFKSTNATNISAWVACLKKLPSLSCFCPINTPFGYYGPPMNAEGKSDSINFSLWSYGAGAAVPPRHKLSRILAIGDKNATFAEFFHEGTGVKVGSFNLWSTNTSQTYIFALRYTKEEKYQTSEGCIYSFHGYYWDESINEWKFYAMGQKFYTTPINSLNMSSFVEVPGPPTRERTNHVKRTVLYKGYARDSNSNEWSQIDQLASTGLQSYTNVRYGVDNDMLAISTGGLEQMSSSDVEGVYNAPSDVVTPLYMSPCKIYVVENSIEFPIVTVAVGQDIEISIDIKNTYLYNTVEIYYGTQDGLTIKRLWETSKILQNIPCGMNKIKIPNESNCRYMRILVISDKNQIWCQDTIIL
jgi:hypothetical protein